MTAVDKLREISRLFEREGIPEPAKEAATLLLEILQINVTKLHSDPPEIDGETAADIDSLVERRIQGEPLQYIIGHVDFWGMRIHVGSGVLIPRPETELLVEETIGVLMASGIKRQPAESESAPRIDILDLCTGSGCIALALAKEFPQACIFGIDRSSSALNYAVKNREYNDIRNAAFVEGDLFSPFNEGAGFDLIVSNPPYIRKGEIPGLQKEISYEPLAALDGGPDGLDFYRRIFEEARHHLRPNGNLILEIGFDQAEDIRRMALDKGFRDIRFLRDYSSIERIFTGRG